MPTNKTNGRCETCYCVENAKACVLQQCDLSIPGCIPRYKKDACCPYKYDCPKKTTSTTPTPIYNRKGCYHKTKTENKFYSDGSPVPSDDPCEHCYCLDSNIICAIQECKVPCAGCIPIHTNSSNCCPERYECCEYFAFYF